MSLDENGDGDVWRLFEYNMSRLYCVSWWGNIVCTLPLTHSFIFFSKVACAVYLFGMVHYACVKGGFRRRLIVCFKPNQFLCDHSCFSRVRLSWCENIISHIILPIFCRHFSCSFSAHYLPGINRWMARILEEKLWKTNEMNYSK